MHINRLPEANPRDIELVNIEVQPNRIEVRNAIDLIAGVEVLTDADVLAIRRAISNGETQSSLAMRFGVHFTIVNGIATGRKWCHLADEGPANRVAPVLAEGAH